MDIFTIHRQIIATRVTLAATRVRGGRKQIAFLVQKANSYMKKNAGIIVQTK